MAGSKPLMAASRAKTSGRRNGGVGVAVTLSAAVASATVLGADPITEGRLSEIESRLTRMEGVLGNEALLDMLQRIEALQTELQAARDAVDRTAHELEIIEERQRELYKDFDQRLRALETASITPPAGAPREAVSIVPRRAAVTLPGRGTIIDSLRSDVAPRGALVTDREQYRDAFNLLKRGRYDDSITAFDQFLIDYPKSDYAANAQYWLAEANYVSGDYEQAADEFVKVIQRYPASTKAPDAKLKLGFTHYELQQWEQARNVLRELNEQYPNTTVAQLAENRLERMDQEGH
jgi:tol-pal system protein YbgF